MKVPVRRPDLDARQRKTLLLSTLGLAAIAASGEGYRRHRRSDGSDFVKKGIVLALVVLALGAIAASARRRRANAAPDLAAADAASSETGEAIEASAASKPKAAATSADGRSR